MCMSLELKVSFSLYLFDGSCVGVRGCSERHVMCPAIKSLTAPKTCKLQCVCGHADRVKTGEIIGLPAAWPTQQEETTAAITQEVFTSNCAVFEVHS